MLSAAALFACATYLGARDGGLSQDECEHLRRYGERLGSALQIVDDLLDICWHERDIGKPVGADLRQGKVTLPVIRALEVDRRSGREIVSALFVERNTDELFAELRRSGSLSYALARAEDAVGEAVSCLEGLRVSQSGEPCLSSLAGTAEYVVSRGREALGRPVGGGDCPRKRTECMTDAGPGRI